MMDVESEKQISWPSEQNATLICANNQKIRPGQAHTGELEKQRCEILQCESELFAKKIKTVHLRKKIDFFDFISNKPNVNYVCYCSLLCIELLNQSTEYIWIFYFAEVNENDSIWVGNYNLALKLIEWKEHVIIVDSNSQNGSNLSAG